MTQSSIHPGAAEALFAPVATARSSERIAEVIRRTIFEGRFRPGDQLPPERTLAERFQVTRNTVREALRHLEQLRLITIRQGSGVTVQDYLATAGIELISALFVPEQGGEKALLKDLLEARNVVGRAICEHAASVVGPKAVGPIDEAVEAFALEATKTRPDRWALQAADFEVQNRLIRAGGNRAFTLLHNSLRHVYERIGKHFEPVVADPGALVAGYRALVKALRASDRAAARRAVAAVFDSGAPKGRAR